MLIKRAVLMLLLIPYLIGTQYMIADIFTKAVDKGSFTKFRDIILNNHVTLRQALAVAVCHMHGEATRLATRLMDRL